jgi:hypothetical protein
MTKKYNVISPDGFPITCEPFASKKAALEYIPLRCQQYERQGYYSTSDLERIPLEELPYCLSVVPCG